MAGIRDQRHRIGQNSKAALDEHESQIQPHGDRHSGIDALGRNAVRMPVRMPMPVRVPMVSFGGVTAVLMIAALRTARGTAMLMAMLMVMVMVMVMVIMAAMIVWLHAPHLTSVAGMSAF